MLAIKTVLPSCYTIYETVIAQIFVKNIKQCLYGNQKDIQLNTSLLSMAKIRYRDEFNTANISWTFFNLLFPADPGLVIFVYSYKIHSGVSRTEM